MRKFTFSFKTLLLLASMLIGGSNYVWATEVTISCDFSTYSSQTLVKGVSVTSGYYLPTVQTDELGPNMAFGFSNNKWKIVNGTGLKWEQTGKNSSYDDNFAILNLHSGDKITITKTSGAILVREANKISGTHYASTTTWQSGTTATGNVPQWGVIISGNEYTVQSDGILYLQAKRMSWTSPSGSITSTDVDYCVIKSINIVTSTIETISAPTIAATAANGAERTITITPSASNIPSGVKTYYTTDGTTPTSTSTRYTGTFTINETTTIKALTISSSSAATTSDITTGEIEAGTTLSLNAPTVTMDMNAVGSYYVPTYTFSSDQSNLDVVPASVICSYSVAGGDAVEASSFIPTTTGGSVTVTVSADGYASAQTTFSVPFVVFDKTTTLDFSSDTYASNTYITLSSTTEGTAYETGNKLQQTIYRAETPSVLADYMAFQQVAESPGTNAWYIRSEGSGKVGLWSGGRARSAAILDRTSGQVVAFNCSQAASNVMTYLNGSEMPDGNYTMLKSSDANTYYATMTADGKVGFCGVKSAGYITSINIYTPISSVSATITSAGYATFSSAYPLDFTDANRPEGLTAYYVASDGVKISSVSLTAANTVVSANTGLLLKGTANATYNIPVSASGSPLEGNKLVATDGTDVASGNYVFAFVTENPTTTAGFYQLSSATNIAAGKAYLNTGISPSKALRLVVDGQATEVTAPEVVETEEPEILYNMAGQIVGKDYKGFVISNKGIKRYRK